MLGRGATMYFYTRREGHQVDDCGCSNSATIHLCVMSGESRFHWKHGIRSRLPTASDDNTITAATWNPYNLRRSLTLRATKCYSDLALEEAVKLDPTDESLRKRLQTQKQYRASEPNRGDHVCGKETPSHHEYGNAALPAWSDFRRANSPFHSHHICC